MERFIPEKFRVLSGKIVFESESESSKGNFVFRPSFFTIRLHRFCKSKILIKEH